jgi:hypothetical protein
MRRHVCRSIALAAVSSLVLGLAGSPALAQGKPGDKPAAGKPADKPAKPKTEKEKKEAAKKLFEDAQAKFAAGEYAAAHDLYKQADELVPGAVPKFKMAESLDKANDVDSAIKAYEAFLASNPPADKNKERIEAAKARIAALQNAPADVKVVVTPAGAANVVLSVDGQPQTGNPVKVPPGKHTISAKADGFDETKIEVEVKRGEKKEVPVTLTPAAGGTVATPDQPKEPAKPEPPKPQPTTESEGTSTLIPAIVTLSLAGAGAVVGGVFGVLALQSKSEFEETPTQDLFDETERNALIADMSFGVALTFGVTGLVLLLTDSSGGEEEKAAEEKKAFNFAPNAGPNGGGAVGTFRF